MGLQGFTSLHGLYFSAVTIVAAAAPSANFSAKFSNGSITNSLGPSPRSYRSASLQVKFPSIIISEQPGTLSLTIQI